MAEKTKKIKAKLLYASAVQFMKNGYTETTVDEICKAAGMKDHNHFFRAFGTKENALLELMPYAINAQMALATKLIEGKTQDKVLWYALEAAAQFYVVEESESLRDMYIVTYSNPLTSDLVYRMMAPRLKDIFGAYLPDYEEKDFYELDVASVGIVRGYMNVKSDLYFTVREKIRRVLETTLRMYRVPEEKIEGIVATVLSLDMTKEAKTALADLLFQLENYREK